MAKLKKAGFDEVRMQAWNILHQVEHSQVHADTLLEKAFLCNPHWSALDRAFLMELVQGILRWRGKLDLAIYQAAHTPRKKIESRLLELLRLGAFQILCLNRVPDSAAVNESSHLAKAVFGNEKITGFTNAILRSVARNKDRINFPPWQSNPIEYLTQALSHPRWMVERWVEEFGPETARKICTANNLRPPFTVRVNTLQASRKNMKEYFASRGINSILTVFSPEGLVLEKSPGLAEDPFFQKGFYFVQDEASQVISYLLDPRPGERVLDACSAPGGKTTHLAQLMQNQGKIIALDLHQRKIDQIRQNCRRLGISMVEALLGDASAPLPWSRDQTFDRILVDAPCSALGILHRNPEIKWRRKPDDILRLQGLQTSILENVSSCLKSGGVIVYSTCTMTREENDLLVENFLKIHRDFQLENLLATSPTSVHPLIDEKGCLRTYPKIITMSEKYRMDGFFASRIRKRK